MSPEPPSRIAMHWFSLAFSEEGLEEAFRRRYAERFVPQARVSLLLGIVLYAAFGALDPYIIPEAVAFAWVVRYAVICPLFLGAFLLTYTASFGRIGQPLLGVLGVFAGAGIIGMILRVASPGHSLYYAGLMLVCMYIYTFFRLRFAAATASAWAVVVLYECAAVGSGTVSVPVLINNNFFLLSVNVIGMFASYSMERSVRVDFLQQRLIAEQAAELRDALSTVRVLSGLLPICAWCKKIRNDRGYWEQMEVYLATHSEATFTHGMCPDCAAEFRASSAARAGTVGGEAAHRA